MYFHANKSWGDNKRAYFVKTTQLVRPKRTTSTQAQHFRAAIMRSVLAHARLRLMILRRIGDGGAGGLVWLVVGARIQQKCTGPLGTNPLTSFEHYNIFIRAKQRTVAARRSSVGARCQAPISASDCAPVQSHSKYLPSVRAYACERACLRAARHALSVQQHIRMVHTHTHTKYTNGVRNTHTFTMTSDVASQTHQRHIYTLTCARLGEHTIVPSISPDLA